MSRATHSIHRRANQIELAAAIGLPILMGLLALLSHMHLDVNHWLSRTVVAMPAPSVLDASAAVGLVAIIVGAILATAVLEAQR